MGAGQWTGTYRTRPHALLDVRGLAGVEDWSKSLSRGARRTLAKAAAQDFSVVRRSISFPVVNVSRAATCMQRERFEYHVHLLEAYLEFFLGTKLPRSYISYDQLW